MSKTYSRITRFFLKRKLLTIFSLAFVFRLLLLPYGTHSSDMGLWHYWAEKIIAFGPGRFYQEVSFCDYLPFYLYFLGGIELIWRFLSHFFNFSKDLLFKLPATLADFGTAYLIFLILKKRSKKIALWLTAGYLFNAAVFFNSSLWGQVDALGALLFLTSIYFLLNNRFVSSGFLIGLSLTMKPIYFLVLPILGLIVWQKQKKKGDWWRKYKPVRNFGAAISTGVLLVTLPFSLKNPLGLLIERYQYAFSVYPYTSVNAFNFWAINNHWWQSDQVRFWEITYQHWGLLVISLVLGLSFLLIWQKRKREDIWLIMTTIFLVLFSFATRVHERHIFTVLPFLTILTGFNFWYGIALLIVSLISTANLYFALDWLLKNGEFIFSWRLINLFSLTIVFTSLVFIILVFRRIRINWRKIKKIVFRNKILILLLVFSFLVRFWQLGEPLRFYFDEVYHAFTATEMAKGQIAAWEWWHQAPEGVAYEWTHPPLAKLFMTLGIFVFGETAFAWRFFSAVFGTGCLWLIYLIGKKLFNQRVALFATLLLAFDGLLLVMSRVGMNDIYFLFFTLLTLWLFLEKRYLFAGLSFGLALASKWTAIYLLPVLGLWQLIELLKQKKRFDFLKRSSLIFIFCFLLLPITVYLFVYLPFFLTNHSLDQWWELQHQMWWYHTRLNATHNYQSSALSWPLLVRPVWFFVGYRPEAIANIYAMGNPIIWWGGLLSLPLVIWQALKRRSQQLGIVLFAYFAFFLPWTFSPRIMFIHHYLPSVIFLGLFLGWALNWLWKSKRFSQIVIYYLLLVIISFFFFYPHWIGLYIPKWLDNLYYFFPSWK